MILKLSLKDTLVVMRDKGELVESGQNDILTQVLSTLEHLGRIKTKGKYVTR